MSERSAQFMNNYSLTNPVTSYGKKKSINDRVCKGFFKIFFVTDEVLHNIW